MSCENVVVHEQGQILCDFNIVTMPVSEINKMSPYYQWSLTPYLQCCNNLMSGKRREKRLGFSSFDFCLEILHRPHGVLACLLAHSSATPVLAFELDSSFSAFRY